ncbi:MAG TPA: flagellar biosynthesis protein FliQ [Syntrophales bacterium]|nr:flagellar biosynthesis protein FliQ [Syntrophobacterales bacterium]HRR41192.1 flagellar biosynthesis protein FliQ [Syntrophales bacterium]HRT26980.1 flagellar biosynthesis protein FliQ [Syntrophales bacterium]HRT69801.1 flagellar biosynthesis protein FliQ [Syntrophales bacterium]
MSPDLIVGIAGETIKVTLLVAAPMLLVGLVIGLVVSIFQAVTQIQEMTLVFVPKILAVLIAMLIVLPWMMNILVTYTQNLFSNIPMYIK